jgi:hypothetical protein
MRTRWFWRLAGLLAVAAAGGCAQPVRSGLDIDPQADDALRRMGTTIGRAKAFSFTALATTDEPVDTGQLARFTRENHVVVRRPDRLRAEARQDEDALFFWYEGSRLTLLDRQSNTYAAFDVPGRIDAMLDEVAGRHGLTLPLADLLLTDPYHALTADAHMGRYIGLVEVDGSRCHHLLFTQELIDWQIWIDAGREAVPRRFVIDYKSLPGRPEFSAVFRDWNLSAPAPDDLFKAAVPKDARRVEIAQVAGAAAKGE